MKDGIIEITGKVTKKFPNARYQVKADSEKLTEPLLCYLAGKLNKKFTKLEIGDKVVVEMYANDLKNGRIVKRNR